MAKVLVIEDNPVNMKPAVLLSHNCGHAVLCAVDAETGLIRARADLPDPIPMDIQLPGMDGLAATAPAMKENQAKSRMAGCAGYIAKPLR